MTIEPKYGWVLYDAQCGVCSRWIPTWTPTIRRAGFDVAPLQAKWARERLGLADDVLTDDIRLLLNDGQVINGADAYLAVMRRIWWLSPLGHLLRLPGWHWLTRRAYRLFNRHRFGLSRRCGWEPELDANEIVDC